MDKNVQWINEKKIERTIVNLEKNNIKARIREGSTKRR